MSLVYHARRRDRPKLAAGVTFFTGKCMSEAKSFLGGGANVQMFFFGLVNFLGGNFYGGIFRERVIFHGRNLRGMIDR